MSMQPQQILASLVYGPSDPDILPTDHAPEGSLPDEVKILKFFEEKAEPGEQRLVYGVVLRPNAVDAHMDIMTMKEVEKTAHRFMANKGKMGLMHEQEADAIVVESYISPVDFPLGLGEVRKGDWVLVSLVINDQIWEKIKSGELSAYSPGGKTRARILV